MLLISCDTQKKDCPEGAICSDEIQTTPTGLKYIHHIKYPKNRMPEYNEVLTMHYLLLTDTGDTLADTYKLNEPVGQPLLGAAYKGAVEEGLKMMHVGDSATLFIITDSLKDENLPFSPKMRAEIKELRYILKVYNVQSQAAFDIDEAARLQKRTEEQVKIQDKKIVEYIEKDSTSKDSKRHPTGLYYTIHQNGTGMPAQIGDSVSFTFKTKLIPQGLLVDESKEGESVGFVLGVTNVLPAWQIAFSQLANKGSKD